MIDADFVEDGRAQHTLCCGVQELEHSGKDRAALPLWAIWFARVQAGRGAAPTLEWGWDQAWSFIETVGNQRTIADQSEVVEQEERKAESEGVPQIWVDGSVSPNGSYGIGAWGMDESGKVIAVATDGGWGRWNPSEVEAKAILMGIDLAKKMKLKRFCLF